MKTAASLVVLLAAGSAFADDRIVTLDRTCMEIDAATDGLAAPDREHAAELMKRVLERADLLVVANACTETYTLSHERTDDAYVIRVRSSAGKRRMTTPALVELSAKYDRMVRSLIDAKAAAALEKSAPPAAPADPFAPEPQVAAAEPAQEPLPTADVTDEPVDLESAERKRGLWYGMLGFSLTGGAAGSFGYRHRYPSGAIWDLGFAFRESEAGNRGINFGAKLFGSRSTSATTIWYAGGGLSLGTMERGEEYSYDGDSQYYWGSGVHADAAAGVQIGKPRGVQFVSQLAITLPFYKIGNHQGMTDYAAGAMLTAGLGW